MNWTKYKRHNFKKGKILNITIGKEISIPGRKCKKCKLLSEK